MRVFWIAAASLACCTIAAVHAQDRSIELEYQRVDTVSNEIRKGDGYSGTRFKATDFTGSTVNEGRVTAFFPIQWRGSNEELRLVIAPFQQSGSAIPARPIQYDGGAFQAGVPLALRYKFNTYRLSYTVPLFADNRADSWQLRWGGTLAIRDARTKLSQPGIERDFKNVGPVPLLYFSASKALGAQWHLRGEFDAFPAPGGGGLFDGSLKIARELARDVELTAGVRYQFGGASGQDFYNFLRQWIGVAGVNWRF